jgi:tetratricopeptide (TPR) repeat protein
MVTRLVPIGFATLCAMGPLTAAAQTVPALAQSAPARPKAAATGQAKTGAPTKKAAPSASAEFLAAQKAADQAREQNHLDDAVSLYFKAVQIKPDWTEGWWYLGTISYDQDRYQPARDAFKRVVMLDQNNALAWGFLGLSEFHMLDYDQPLQHLMRARLLHVQKSAEVAATVRYHAAIIFTRMGKFEQAGQLLNEFAIEGNDNPRVIEAFGIATLKLPLLPSELPPEKRDVVMLTGRAEYFSAARVLTAAKQAFEQVVVRYPETPNLHFAYGAFLLGEEPDLALEELQKELKISPNHSLALLSIAFEYIRRSDFATARIWAEKAVAAEPGDFVARKALGQVLLEQGEVDAAIQQLEIGVKLASDSPVLHFQLAKAYQKAGRSAEAERERAEFTRLDRAVRAARAGSQSVGGTGDTDRAATATPNQPD